MCFGFSHKPVDDDVLTPEQEEKVRKTTKALNEYKTLGIKLDSNQSKTIWVENRKTKELRPVVIPLTVPVQRYNTSQWQLCPTTDL